MFELTPELYQWSVKIEKLAREEYGLDFYPVEFLLVPSKFLNQVASHIGFPSRFKHWTHGLEYEKLKTRYDWGLGKIYELVINNNPCYAYLMENNSLMIQKLVMAHVFGHAAVFKSNIYFSSTRRDMVDVIATNASRIDKYYRKYGIDEVEEFLDACMSIQEHIDCFAPFANKSMEKPINENQLEDEPDPVPPKVQCPDHLDEFINPEKELQKKKEEMIKKMKEKPWFPDRPQKDLLLFLLMHAPLKKWQEDILSIIREESYYFNPQRQTKVLNEGFASYYHWDMMTKHLIDPSECLDFAMDHSGVLARSPYTINPYFLGFTLLKDIEERWDEGRYGREYNDCTNAYEKQEWSRPGADGYKKLKEIMVIDNDYSLIDKYFTREYCQKHEFYQYGLNKKSDLYEITTRDFERIKNTMLDQMANSGIPYITVVDGNYRNRKELLLLHKHEFDLDLKYAKDTLRNINLIWKRPVHLLTRYNDEPRIISYGAELEMDGAERKDYSEKLYASHIARI